jgi:predicted SnoaL-like aldol condensation-catalyzing enzyme
MRTPEEAKEISRRFIDEVFNQRNLKHAEEMLSEAFVEHSPAPPSMGTDKAAAIEGFRFFVDASDDLRVEILEQVSDGDRVAIRARYAGTDTGGLAPGAPATGKTFDIEGIDVAVLDGDGRFSEHYGIADFMTAMGQLGLMPPSGA